METRVGNLAGVGAVDPHLVRGSLDRARRDIDRDILLLTARAVRAMERYPNARCGRSGEAEARESGESRRRGNPDR